MRGIKSALRTGPLERRGHNARLLKDMYKAKGQAMLKPRVVSGRKSLPVWGDLILAAADQVVRPGWMLTPDADPAVSIATRRARFDMVFTYDRMMAGMHLTSPVLAKSSARPGATVLSRLRLNIALHSGRLGQTRRRGLFMTGHLP